MVHGELHESGRAGITLNQIAVETMSGKASRGGGAEMYAKMKPGIFAGAEWDEGEMVRCS
jgi:hypothetical protein